MPKLKIIVLFAAILLLVGCASTGPDTPQTEVDGTVVSEGEYDPDREFSDEEVATFARAYVRVTAIQQDFQTRIQHAEGPEREELINESNLRSEEAMEEEGLTAQEFNAIAVRLPDNDDLRARVQSAVQELEAQRIEETERQLAE